VKRTLIQESIPFGTTALSVTLLVLAPFSGAATRGERQQQPPPAKPPVTAPAQTQKAPSPTESGENQAGTQADPDAELQKAIDSAGNDRAAFVKNLEAYLKRFPDSPRKPAIYRALVEAELALRDQTKALEYAELTIKADPQDSSMMLMAANILEDIGEDAGLQRAIGYISTVLDRVQKTSIDEKPVRDSEAEWRAQQKDTEMTLYMVRGKLEAKRHTYDSAITDLQASYKIEQNSAAALELGQIAELQKKTDLAIDQYLIAFVLPSQESAPVDRADVRKKLGNLWQQEHGSQAGLGERILQTYDKLNDLPKSAAADPNGKAKEPYDFVLGRPDGSAPLKMMEQRGKVVVIDFWATWCGPCRETEPLLEQVAQMFKTSTDIVFLALNSDEDRSRVTPYVAKEKITGTLAFADGLDELLNVRSLPTVIVLDRTGKISYRSDGIDPDTFQASLAMAILQAAKTQ
jgi:thiol-disulfide isomerase/thioredoxin